MSHDITMVASSLDLNNLSWQRRSFAKSNNIGKVGLHFVPGCNPAQESHTSFFCCCFFFFGGGGRWGGWDLEILQPWQCSINDFSLLLGLFRLQSCTEAKKANHVLHMHTEYFYSKTSVCYCCFSHDVTKI